MKKWLSKEEKEQVFEEEYRAEMEKVRVEESEEIKIKARRRAALEHHGILGTIIRFLRTVLVGSHG